MGMEVTARDVYLVGSYLWLMTQSAFPLRLAPHPTSLLTPSPSLPGAQLILMLLSLHHFLITRTKYST
jgi:hypothetical protein